MSLKRWVSLALAAMLILGVIAVGAGCSQSKETTGAKTEPFPTIKKIQAKKELVIGTSGGYMPFEMIDKKGQLIGFDIDTGKKIADALGVAVKWQDMDFDGLIPALSTGKIDMVLAGMTITPKRALSVNFVQPGYFLTGQVVMYNKQKNPNVTKWQDFDVAGKTIALSMGTTGDLAATDMFKKATLKRFDSSTNAGLEVVNGRADAMVYDYDWIRLWVKRNPDQLASMDTLLTTEHLGVAIAPGQPDFLQWLSTFMYNYVGSQEYNTKLKYWFTDMPWWNEVEQKK